MLVSELSMSASARRNVKAMTGPCQTLQRSNSAHAKLPKGKRISHTLRRYKALN